MALKTILKHFSGWDVSNIIGMTFIALLAIILFIWDNNEQRLLDMQVVIEQNQNASKKMQLVNQLIEISRARSRLTSSVIYEKDPFVRDELAIEMDTLAGDFAGLRIALIKLPLSDKEKSLLEQQAQIVPTILPAQRRSVDLAFSDDEESLQEAERLLHEVVHPGQNALVKILTKLINYQQSNIDELAIKSQESYEAARKQNTALVSMVFIVGSLLCIVVVLRVRNIQRKVANTRDFLEVAVDKRTQELAESQSMLRTVLDTIPTRVYWKDISGRYLGCNRLFARDAGREDTSDIKGKSDSELINNDTAKEFSQEDFNTIKTGVPLVDKEELATLSDSEMWREVTRVPLKNNNGDIVGMLGSYHDITDRKRMERIKDNFVSTVSHELRTPITSIYGSISILLEKSTEKFTPKTLKLLNLADRNIKRLLALINDLLDIQKMLLGEMSYKFNTVDLETVLSNSVEDNIHYATQHGVEYVITESTSLNVSIDEPRIMQVISNLLSNAAKFATSDTCVDVSLTREDNTAVVKVTNRGDGIPEEFRDAIFERFTQLDASDTRQKGGTGLGLAISRSIIKHHNGTIDFDSTPGVGTTFYFKLEIIDN